MSAPLFRFRVKTNREVLLLQRHFGDKASERETWRIVDIVFIRGRGRKRSAKERGTQGPRASGTPRASRTSRCLIRLAKLYAIETREEALGDRGPALNERLEGWEKEETRLWDSTVKETPSGFHIFAITV